VNLLKLGYTRAGAAIIENEIRAVFTEGVSSGAFSPDVPAIISVPDPVTVDPNLRAQRKLEGITFEFRLGSAIHKVGIKGVLTV
jgi:hypothetical protein